jgi:signal peptidase II
MIYYVIALIILALDQFTKWLIVKNMDLGQSISVIGEFFQITSHRNKGAAFGILQDQRLFFIIITIVFVVGIIWYLEKVRKYGNKKLLTLSLSLLLGGAIGNFADRLLTGEVVDFFDFYFAFINYPFPIFNVADSAIVVGVILIFLDTLLDWINERKGVKDDLEQSEKNA